MPQAPLLFIEKKRELTETILLFKKLKKNEVSLFAYSLIRSEWIQRILLNRFYSKGEEIASVNEKKM